MDEKTLTQERIDACVNACEGIPTESIKDFMDYIRLATYIEGGKLEPSEKLLEYLGPRTQNCWNVASLYKEPRTSFGASDPLPHCEDGPA